MNQIRNEDCSNYDQNIKPNDTFLLKDENGVYFGKADSNDYQKYYPEVATNESDAGRLVVKGISGDLSNNGVIQIQTLDKDVWESGWNDYDLLGAFDGKTELYYWIEYGEKTNWQIVLPSNSKSNELIQYGQQVYIKNVDCGEYLTPHSNGFLTTEPSAHTWQFIDYKLLNLTFVRVEYDLDNAEISDQHLEVVGHAEQDNNTNSTTTLEVTIGVEETISSSFERTEGYEVSLGYTFSTGIPEILSVDEEITISETQELTYGTEETFTNSYEVVTTVDVPGRSKAIVDATETKAKLDVPYTMYFRTSDGEEVKSCGIWSGTTYYNIQFDVSTVPLK